MAESELETVKDTTSENISTARPHSISLPQEEEISGGEEIVSSREERTSGAPTSASVTADAVEHPHASRHADTPTTALPLALVEYSTSIQPAQAPSYRVQFTPSTAECYSRDEISTTPVQQSLLESVLTPQRDGGSRDEQQHSQDDSDSVEDQHTPRHTVSGGTAHSAARVLDSPSQSSAMSTPIATPIPTPITQSMAHSLSKELGVSPYVVVKGGLVEAAQYESPGLLYARSTKESHNLDILKPADEVAEDVLEIFEGDSGHKLSWEEDEELDREREGGREGEKSKGEEEGIGIKKLHSFESRGHHTDDHPSLDTSLSSLEPPRDVLTTLDPNILRDLERQAHKVASSLEYIMDNLHNSLHAMTVCAKQSMLLHREAVENLHSVVDTNVKATYSFLAKFEELKLHTAPLNDLAQQINDINKILKILERNFRTP